MNYNFKEFRENLLRFSRFNEISCASIEFYTMWVFLYAYIDKFVILFNSVQI